MWNLNRSSKIVLFLILFMVLPYVNGLKVKVFCFGEDFSLVCPKKTVLLIRVASVSLLPMDSKICTNKSHLALASGSCNVLNYSESLKSKCDGKSNCTIESHKQVANCKHVFVLSVLYTCELLKANKTTQSPSTIISITRKRPPSTGLIITATRPTSIVNTGTDKKPNAMTYTLFTLLSASMALKFIQGRPKHVILCVVLSISAGIVLLIICILLMVCLERFLEERKKAQNNQLEISLPLLVSPPNQTVTPPTENQTLINEKSTSAAPSEAGSHRDTTLPRMQSIYRRSHSVDEGTQTEAALEDFPVDDHRISDSEAKELGYLVDIMKYYSNNHKDIETASAVDGNFTDKSETPITRPRIVDTSRSRQARLSSTTYSSSNNSVFGENHVTNHIGTSASPHSRHKTRYNSFGHNNHTLGSYSSRTLENGPRRAVGRTRAGYPNAVTDRISDRVSNRPYGTLS